MSEERLRELERRWRQSGAASDQAALLAERVRAGLLPAARLRLAAALGQPAARLALGGDAPALLEQSGNAALMAGLEPYGPAAWVRATWAVLRTRLEHERAVAGGSASVVAAREARQLVGVIEVTLAALGAWCRDPAAQAPEEDAGDPERPLDHAVQIAEAADEDGYPQAVAAIVAALVPWALGEGDPVAAEGE